MPSREIIQEMTIIWTKADYYDPSVAPPSTWIYTIARNKKIDILKKPEKRSWRTLNCHFTSR